MGKVINTIARSIFLDPLLDRMKKERKEEVRRYNSLLNQASQNVLAEREEQRKPKTFEVHQPFDSIVHEHRLW